MPFTKVSNTVKNNSQQVTMTDTTQSTNKDTGTLIIEGGIGVEKRLSVGNAILFPIWTTGIAYVVGDIVKHATLADLYTCIVAHTSGTFVTDVIAGDWVKMTKNSDSSNTVTDTYTILDYDNYDTIFANPSARAFPVNLPTLSANIGRIIKVKVIAAGGAVSLTPEGAETIDNVNAAFVMQSSGDHCTVVAQTTGWRILSAYAKLDTGWINTADWSNRHFGSQTVTYNAGAGSYIVGETITEQTSNNTAIIMADTGAILTVKNVTGTGIFINGRNLTGSTSGCIRTVNGNTKNQDSNVLHNAGVTLPNLKARVLMSFNATGTDAIAMETNDAAQDGTNYWGKTILYIDTNNIKVQTGDSLNYIDENGVFQSIDTEDYSYKVIVERII